MKPLQQYFPMVLFVFNILQNEIWKFCLLLTLTTSGSERVNMVMSYLFKLLNVTKKDMTNLRVLLQGINSQEQSKTALYGQLWEPGNLVLL